MCEKEKQKIKSSTLLLVCSGNHGDHMMSANEFRTFFSSSLNLCKISAGNSLLLDFD